MIAAAAATAAAVLGGPQVPEPPVEAKPVRPPVIRMSWSVPRRYERAWSAWRPSARSYARSYVQPSRWRVDIDLCRSSGGDRSIRRYGVRIQAVGSGYRRGVRTPRCRIAFRDLPRLGAYDLTLSLYDGDGAIAETTERIAPRDRLVVSLGDSMASGEGNPDRPGRYSVDVGSRRRVDWIWNAKVGIEEHRRVRWNDRRCHRSARNGHALFARDLEASDPHTSVTFVSLACSGAKLVEGLLAPYDGIEPPSRSGRARDHRRLPAQVDALAAMVGHPVRSGGRTIDALLLSAGINDIHFSDVIEGCATNLRGPGRTGSACVDEAIGAGLQTLGPRYDRLGRALRDRVDVAETYITDYPSNAFDGGGCGLLGAPRFGINRWEARRMADVGGRLNAQIRLAAARNGWSYLAGMTDGFAGHPYCARDGFLVSLEASFARQGNRDGAVHPNRSGHRVLRNLLDRGVVLDRPAYPHRRVTITVERLRIGEGFPPRARLDLTALSGEPVPTRHVPVIRSLAAPPTGAWVDVPPEAGRFEIDVYDAPQPQRRATAYSLLLRVGGATAGATHTAADELGAGTHELTDVQGRFALRYRVDVRTVPPPPEASSG